MGKGTPQVQPVNPAAEARAQIQLERERASLDERARIAAQQREDAQRARDLDVFNNKLDTTFNSTRSSAIGELESQGLDLDRFTPLLDQSLQNVRSTVPELHSAPGSFFNSDTIVNGLIDKELTKDRRDLNREFDAFAGSGFATQMLGDNTDDAIIDKLLSDRYADAATGIERSRDRGQLTNYGFDTALSSLNEQRTAARSRLEDLGRGFLETGRESLRTIADNGRDKASTFFFGDDFDTNTFKDRINTTANDFTSGLEGKFLNGIGNDGLFDINTLLQRGGTAQGAQNATGNSAGLLAALSADNEKKSQNIGLGNLGAF